ncbi:MAG: ankyrin repeat domain-containing protein [Parvularculales bacterium]
MRLITFTEGGATRIGVLQGESADQIIDLSHAEPSLPVEMIEARDEKFGASPLHFAVMVGNTEMIGVLLDHGANIEAPDEMFELTALHLVAGGSTPSVVEILLDRGADATAPDNDGDTPFNYAKSNEALKNTEAYWRLHDAQYR